MKKLFAIVAAVSAAMAMGVILASCGDDSVLGASDGAYLLKKTTSTPTEPEPTPTPTPEPTDTTQVVIGFHGVVVGGEFKRVTNEYWPSVKFVENDEGTQSHGGNLRPLAKWEQSFNNKVFTLNDTETEETRFLRVEKTELDDCGYEIDTDTLRVGFMAGEPDAILTNDIAIPFNVERRYGWVVVGGKYEALDNGLNKYEYVIEADVIGEDTVFTGDEVYLREEVELTLKMKVTNAYYTDEDVIHIFIDRKIVLPEKEEPEPEPEEVEEPATDPEPTLEPVEEPTPDPVEETPVVEEPVPPTINLEIEGLQSFNCWTMVMDGNKRIHNAIVMNLVNGNQVAIIFGTDEDWKTTLTDNMVHYLDASLVKGEGFNSVNWDPKTNSWVPAVCGFWYGHGDYWYYSSPLTRGEYIDITCSPNEAKINGNNNYSKNDVAKTTWKVEATAQTSEYNGQKIITVNAHKYNIDKDYKFVFAIK